MENQQRRRTDREGAAKLDTGRNYDWRHILQQEEQNRLEAMDRASYVTIVVPRRNEDVVPKFTRSKELRLVVFSVLMGALTSSLIWCCFVVF